MFRTQFDFSFSPHPQTYCYFFPIWVLSSPLFPLFSFGYSIFFFFFFHFGDGFYNFPPLFNSTNSKNVLVINTYNTETGSSVGPFYFLFPENERPGEVVPFTGWPTPGTPHTIFDLRRCKKGNVVGNDMTKREYALLFFYEIPIYF